MLGIINVFVLFVFLSGVRLSYQLNPILSYLLVLVYITNLIIWLLGMKIKSNNLSVISISILYILEIFIALSFIFNFKLIINYAESSNYVSFAYLTIFISIILIIYIITGFIILIMKGKEAFVLYYNKNRGHKDGQKQFNKNLDDFMN